MRFSYPTSGPFCWHTVLNMYLVNTAYFLCSCFSDLANSEYFSPFHTGEIAQDVKRENSEDRVGNLNIVDEEFKEWLNDMANYDVDEGAAQKNNKVIRI